MATTVTRTRSRSAVSGHYVKKDSARRRPKTTITEKDKVAVVTTQGETKTAASNDEVKVVPAKDETKVVPKTTSPKAKKKKKKKKSAVRVPGAMARRGDNYGDGSASIRCQLALNHEGLHREQFERQGGTVTITWTADEREKCDHACGQWDHDHRRDIACPKDADDHEWSDCAFCHPGEVAQTCNECSKSYYYEDEHKRHCPGAPFACTDCGENGFGYHVCPKSSDGSFDTAADPSTPEGTV